MNRAGYSLNVLCGCQMCTYYSLLTYKLLFYVLRLNIFCVCTQSRADDILWNESLRWAWSLFITNSLCHQSEHPLVIILLNASDWCVMEGSTINSCFFRGRTLWLLQNFKFSLIIRQHPNSKLLRNSFWCCLDFCVCLCACICLCGVCLALSGYA